MDRRYQDVVTWKKKVFRKMRIVQKADGSYIVQLKRPAAPFWMEIEGARFSSRSEALRFLSENERNENNLKLLGEHGQGE